MKTKTIQIHDHRIGYEAPDVWVEEVLTEDSFLSFQLPYVEEEEEEW